MRWFRTLLSFKSPEVLDQWPINTPLRAQPTIQEVPDIIHSLTNGDVIGPDGIPVTLFKIALNGHSALRQRLFDIVVSI